MVVQVTMPYTVYSTSALYDTLIHTGINMQLSEYRVILLM